jgi:hypothetical protein
MLVLVMMLETVVVMTVIALEDDIQAGAGQE